MEAPTEFESEIIDVVDIEDSEKELCLVGRNFTENCQSYNQNLRRKNVDGMLTTLPHDIIESILSRLPVKALLRFKVVSKLWEATISGPRFAKKHLQHYKNSFSRNLLANLLSDLDELEDEFEVYKGLHVFELQNDSIHSVLEIAHSRECSSGYRILCNCDGLYLKWCQVLDGINTYVLWNPSCRAYKEIFCPQEIDDSYRPSTLYGRPSTLYGIYYHPLKNDYMVVIADKKHYAVFSCRCNKWSEVKEIQGLTWNTDKTIYNGVSCNGCVYWSFMKIERHTVVAFEIIYFDWKDEKIKKLALPDCNGEVVLYYLSSSGGHLCLFNSSHYSNEMRIMKKLVGDGKGSWMVIKVPMLAPIVYPMPICWVSEDEIILQFNRLSSYMLYDLRKNTFITIHNCRYFEYDYVVPYQENLFLQ